MPRRLNDPGGWRIRDAFDARLVHVRGKSFMSCIFRHFKVAECFDQCGNDAAPIGFVSRLDGGVSVCKHARCDECLLMIKTFRRSVDWRCRHSTNCWEGYSCRGFTRMEKA